MPQVPLKWNQNTQLLDKLIERTAEIVNSMVCICEAMHRPEMPWRKLPGREYTETALKRIKEQYPPTPSSAVQASGGKVDKPLTYVEAIETFKKEFDAEIDDKPQGAPF